MSTDAAGMTETAGNSCDVRPLAAPGSRLVSIDAYRGLVMVLLVMNGWGIHGLAKSIAADQRKAVEQAFGEPREEFSIAKTIEYHSEHVPWQGCAFWDLIQPSFMFLVGVAVPFSLWNRRARGQSDGSIYRHAVTRSLILIALGVALQFGLASGLIKYIDFVIRNLSFAGAPREIQMDFSLMNVLSQIGLGYCGLILLAGKPRWLQVGVGVAILLAYWGWFAMTPIVPARDLIATVDQRDPPPGAPSSKLQFTEADFRVGQLDGFSEHWSMHRNPAAAVDRSVLGMLPFDGQVFHVLGWKVRLPLRYFMNKGGYQTLNFVPSFVTMLYGLILGEILLRGGCRKRFTVWLFAASIFALYFGMMLGQWEICPVVKRIWTPSFTVFSAGWLGLFLSGFILTTDIWGATGWTYLLRVVGANSILAYVFSQTLSRPMVNGVGGILLEQLIQSGFEKAVAGPVSQVIGSMVVFLFVWVVLEQMYRRKYFVRI